MENNLQYKGKYIYNWFSNFEPITIIIDNVKYPSVENYYQSQKTLDLEVQIDKLKQKSPDYRKSWLTNLMWWKD